VRITVEVPEQLVGDIYMAVGRAIQLGLDELDESTEQAAPSQGDDDDDDDDDDETAGEA
jgi:hypothetical protein